MRNRKKGFTLIELLVVISVIALLMAILMPALQRAREQGMRAVCLSNLKQLTLSWIMYADSNGDKIVNGSTWDKKPRTGGLEKPWTYADTITASKTEGEKLQYIKTGALFVYVKDARIYKCPTGIRGELRTYGIVDSMNGHNPTSITGLLIKHRMQIRRPAQRAVFIDIGFAAWGPWSLHYLSEAWWNQPPLRHGKGANMSFADGHSEYWKWKDPRTVELGEMPFAEAESTRPHYQPENEDLRNAQLAVWGELGYDPN